ncbi:hypothetical protein EMN47_14825 [Prolixibacteraceae bacterium JC049]|nr:hypothetical protein [Prolixibacteraceae bacterium JC049]
MVELEKKELKKINGGGGMFRRLGDVCGRVVNGLESAYNAVTNAASSVWKSICENGETMIKAQPY